MARRSEPETLPEADRIEGQPHPREVFDLIGHREGLARAARAIRGGRPPQAWLIAGPQGIGKATLAYRIARYLLRYGATAEGPEDLAVAPKDPVSQQVAAGAHPGLLVLRRAVNERTGKLMNVLSVDEVRKLSSFFGMTSGAGGWRIAIIDTADDMNDAAANALLKTLEEPPARAMIMVLSNNPGRLVSTIRSRCQRLDLRPLQESEVEDALRQKLPDLDEEERASLARLSGGSIGTALVLAEGEGVALAREADRLIETATHPDVPALLNLGDRLARATDGLETFGTFLANALSGRIRAKGAAGITGLDRWIEASEKVRFKFARSSALYLDPRQTVVSAAMTLGDAARRGAI
ncbi:MAG TPA: DNA polymerase III subunit delta' [Rhizomicrobium sp.]|nr:DNA polymerase III subunit delta' [Rhizomicrobium sp.]